MSAVQPSDCTTLAAVCSASDKGTGGAIDCAVVIEPELVELVLAVLLVSCVVVSPPLSAVVTAPPPTFVVDITSLVRVLSVVVVDEEVARVLVVAE